MATRRGGCSEQAALNDLEPDSMCQNMELAILKLMPEYSPMPKEKRARQISRRDNVHRHRHIAEKQFSFH
jgi:hypothetical protein